jgi:ATP-binding cassette, subfamily B, multidrug efflux pump
MSSEKKTAGDRLRWLWRYWTPHRHWLVLLALLTLVSTAVTVAYPLVVGKVLDRLRVILSGTGPTGSIAQILLVLGGIMVGRFLAGFYPATRAMMNLRLEVAVREDVFGRLMGKDHAFATKFRTGDVVTRLTDDVAEFPKIAWFGCSGIFRAIESASKMIFCLAAMGAIHWKLALFAVVPLPIMMWVFYSLRHRLRTYMQSSQQMISKTNDQLEAAFSGIRIVKAFRAEEGQKKRLAEIMQERVRIFFGLVRLQMLVQSLDMVASRFGQMIVLAFGGFMVIRGELTVGTLYAFYVYLDMLTQPMMDVPFLFMAGQQAFVSIDRAEEIRSYPVRYAREGERGLEEIEEIAFDGVSFAYEDGRKVLDGISFRAPAGSRIAIVGPVASGKSTVLKLIAGILAPAEGEVRVNGRPLPEWNWTDYRTRIGYVPQEGVLFSETIEKNVLFGRAARPGDGTDEQWARRCLSVAQMDDDLHQLPDGVRTVVGQKGGLVSGGQKQRVAIARALAGRPQVLLFDDCTAALDAQNEDRFWHDLAVECGGRSAFIVSHRLATIRRADVILVLERGRLVDQGTHEELAVRCQTYREFLHTEEAKAHLAEKAVEA